MRLLISHIYALQTVDVPDSHEVDEDVDEDGYDDGDEDDCLVICFVASSIIISADNCSILLLTCQSYFGRQDLVICVSPASMAST